MPKQIYKVFQFHGGLNNDADPRDIAENELSNLQNVAVDKLGRVVILGDMNTAYKTIASSPAITGSGGGVLAIATDYDGFLSGSADVPGQVYWLVEKAEAITGLGEDNEAGTIGVTDLLQASMYFVDGALRIYEADHTNTDPVTPQWRGYIKGVLYGTIDASGAPYLGYIYNSGGSSADKWYTTNAQITGCFPESVTSTGDVSVGVNLIMGSEQCQNNNADYIADGEASDVFAFADEKCATGTGPGSAPGNATTESDMFWGHALLYNERDDGSGTWAPNGNESYQFWCTTIYDGVQESLPQLFTMYPTGVQAIVQKGGGTANTYGPESQTSTDNSYINAVPEASLQFGKSSNYDAAGQNIALFLEPRIKWCGADHANTDAVSSQAYNFGASTVGSTSGGNPRITGLRVYWAGSEDGYVDKWLLYEWDFAKGVKAIGSTGGAGGGYNRTDWTNAGGTFTADGSVPYYWYHHTHGSPGGTYGLVFNDPPKFITYEALTGHTADDIITVDSFKTSVVANRRTYIGNVEIDGVVHSDRMLKSPPNEFDKFPVEAGHVDVAINDGDEIIALFEHADRILQFKKNTLYIINVSGGAEFLESEHKFKGITNPGAGCKTDYGIAWVNQNGCYIYDGKQVSDLLEMKGNRKISLSTWNTFIGTAGYHRIGYNPAKRQLIVKAGTDAATAYVFDITTGSWTYSSAMVSDPNTNSSFINDPVDGKLLIFDDGAETFDKWVDTPASAPSIIITTKDIDFGHPGLKKNVYKVRITYTGGTSQNCDVTYAVDGSGSFSAMSADLNYTTNTTQQIVDITPSSSVTDIKSFQLKISGTAATTFELNDISIIYRVKGAR